MFFVILISDILLKNLNNATKYGGAHSVTMHYVLKK